MSLEPQISEYARPAWYFGEDQGRYVVATDKHEELQELAASENVLCWYLGSTQDEPLIDFGDEDPVPLTALREASDSFFRDWMEG